MPLGIQPDHDEDHHALHQLMWHATLIDKQHKRDPVHNVTHAIRRAITREYWAAESLMTKSPSFVDNEGLNNPQYVQ